MSLKTLTIGELCVSPYNARTNQADANAVDGMAESLMARGQLYPLVVHPMKRRKGEPQMYGALAGGRRYRAFRQLVDEGRLPADHPIEVIVREGVDEGELIDLSLAENLVRVDLRPYEVCAAVHRAFTRGRSLQEIADTNGQTLETVRRWQRLGSLHPDVFAALERGDITLDHARAFGATDDRELQLVAFRGFMRQSPYLRSAPNSASVIRKMLKIGDAETMLRLRFVGEEAYRQAGGRYELDLFAEDAEERGRVTDEGLLARLADDKLEQVRARLRRQAARDLRFEVNAALSHPLDLWIDPAYEWRSEADARAAERLRAQMDELEAQAEQLLETPETDERKTAIAAIDDVYLPAEAQLRAIEDRRRLILPDGAVVVTLEIEEDGSVDIRFWWASHKDKKQAAGNRKAAPAAQPDAASAAGRLANARIPEGAAIGQVAGYGYRQSADAALKREQGLTADAVQILRSLRREMLRALLLEDAEAAGQLGTRLMIWSIVREDLARYAVRSPIGVRGLRRDDDPGPSQASDHVERTAAHARWAAARQELAAHPCIAEPDPVKAFEHFLFADEDTRRRAGAIAAGIALERSANAEGYRVPLHDFLAQMAGGTAGVNLAALVEPTEELVALMPKAEMLAQAEPFVDDMAFRTWKTLKLRELVGPATRALKRARSWVHPLLRFQSRSETAPPAASTPEAQPIEERA